MLEAVRIALNGALRLVEAEGDALARLRLHALLGLAPTAELVAVLAQRQLPSGAFGPSLARFAGPEPGPASTLAALLILDDVRALHGEPVARAVAYLEGAQRSDGAFAPAAAASEDDVLVLTGLLGGTLARSQRARPALLQAAGAYLGAAFSPERVKAGAWEVLAAFARFFSNVAHELSDPALQWCGRELDHGYRRAEFDAVRTSRVFTLCDAQALPGARTDTGTLLPALLAAQAEDGGFGEGGRRDRVEATLDAALALVRFAQAR